ncbi:MAG TPA: ThuA domain-containing protein [Candidatus Fimadaptatus faecigallinarum]|uniref:ThuA domain-containing protein n=1 Tax=Candidatus Fimadaptatus faecigallinarum TaxID=2840814 RepID=A0A9D1S5B6_9FIRM|nr:ThuA domain-containing protein [Candidatus Fimadaptatus faecigallinarum]
MRVTVWNEYEHERREQRVAQVYPQGIHTAIANFLSAQPDMQVRTATLDEPENGLPQAVLDDTDVLIWWGHMAHEKVADEVALRVKNRVLDGMGFIALHSAHASKPFQLLMGTHTTTLRWRENDELQRYWVVAPGHPIVAGLGEYFEIPKDESYGEYFDIPQPDLQVFISWVQGGEVFRSGCCWRRGAGRVFYFQGGHETYPIYYQSEVQRVITNAVRWAAPLHNEVELRDARHCKVTPNQLAGI